MAHLRQWPGAPSSSHSLDPFAACHGGKSPKLAGGGSSPHLPPSERLVEGWDWGEKRTFSSRSWLEGRSKHLPAPRAGEDTDLVHPPWPEPRRGCKPPRWRQSGIAMPAPCLGCPPQGLAGRSTRWRAGRLCRPAPWKKQIAQGLGLQMMPRTGVTGRRQEGNSPACSKGGRSGELE